MEPSGSGSQLKRPRAPLSDSEDNVFSSSERNDGQKRQRLDRAGQENLSPKTSSGRSTEQALKPDTPAINSVRSRVQQLTQRREGGPVLAQRCLSDPGADNLSIILHNKGFTEHLLGEDEFHQRMERFKAPIFQPSPSLVPSSPRTCSNLVSGIQQKLQDSLTPSSKQAVFIRQEREKELRLINAQPISENAWLKRSSSDPTISEKGRVTPGPSPSTWTPHGYRRKVHWPPVHPWDQGVNSADGSFTETLAPKSEKPEEKTTGELSSHDETNTAEMIDQMFEEVLEYAGRMEEERRDNEDAEDRDSGIGNYSGDKSKMDTESEKERSEEEEGEQPEKKCLERGGENEALETSEDELLTFPPSGILSPLSKSVEAVVTPLRLAVSTPPSLLLTPEEEPFTAPAAESAPLYSIDAYRTQRQSKLPAIQSVTPAVQRRAPEKSRPPPSISTKEKIVALTEEARKLQTVISQTLQALGCCTDETHGRGSLEEAEAEKLLLVSCEKRAALLAEVTRLRDERGSASEEPAGADGDYISQQPCRGTVNIGNVQLPLKVEFVCSSRNRKGRPSHYFFILIRYGPCNIVATPLATAADAKNGDTISFPTSVTLKDIRSNFEIDVEVYSLAHASGSTCTVDRISTKPRVTPRKLLSTITHRSNNSLTASTLPALNTRRSSSFCLVGSHKITLSSLGQTKFPLDKMKFDGKIRKLLGDEFQEKVPFLSPLEGNIYLRLDSEGHSSVQHQGFLTMFEVVNGFGAWHRRFFTLEGSHMFYWNHPNDKEAKAAEGTISLASSPSLCVKPVKRDSCARPFTFELVSNLQTQLRNEAKETVAKRWFSSDTKQERCDWMDKLNQVLLDLHTWTPTQAHSQPQEASSSSSSSLRESLL
ncbi:anillin, actin binding protein 2 isoform X8 [Gadus macrocephalus]|uniref:anillin, actin binding protein 2 isoform X8 n=1 Tax=Gadus macrocephalus TaxID=80720 RepID=UPI0028CBBE71|nr:anillin, actin binding protein 2 isoform X8 [Gadus macrocephalus]